MTDRTEIRTSRIFQKIQQYRRQKENQIIFFTVMCSFFLFLGIESLLKMVQTPLGISTVADGYGTVLLRDGAGVYVLVGIAGFVVGMALTIICIKCKIRSKHKDDR